MATVNWAVDADGDWESRTNWSTGLLPGSNDSVNLNSPDPHTVTHSTGGDAIASLTATTDTLAVTGGSLRVTGTATLGAGLALSGGTLALGSGSISGGFTASGGILALGAGGVVTVSGAATIDGQATLNGIGTLATTGATTVADGGGSVAMVGGVSWSNTAGTVWLGGTVLTGGLHLSNAVGAHFNLTSDAAGIINGAGGSSFINAGALAKTGGTGTSEIDSVLTSTGTICVASGTLLLTAGGSLSGVLNGAGTLQLASGSTTQLGNLTGGGTLLSLGVLKASGNVGITSNLVQQGGSLSLATGAVVTTSGSLALLGGAIVTGLATLTTAGATSIGADGSAIYLRGGISWLNQGAVTLGGEILTLNGSTITNAAGSQFVLGSDAAGILNDGGPSTLNNAGLLQKSGGSGTSEIDSTLNSTSTIEIDSGTLLLTTGGSISGVLSGSGTLELGAGSSTQLGSLTGVGSLLSLGVLKASGTVSIANTLVQQGGSVSLGTGAAVTTSGSLALLDGAIVTGMATLTTVGATSVGADGNAIYLRGGVSWINQGAVTLSDQILTLNASTITNAANSVFVLASDAAGILNDGGPSTFNNAGLLQKSGGSGVSEIDSTLNSTSNIEIDSGALLLTTGGSISGVLSGSGTLELGASSTTQLGGLGNGAGSANILSMGVLKVTGTANDAVSLAQLGGTLSLSSAALLAVSGNFSLLDGAIVAGLATLTTNGVTSVGPDGSAVYLRGGVTWNNHASLSLGGALETLNSATLTNGVNASLSLISDGAGILNDGGTSTLLNMGVLAKTGGTGTSEIDSKLTSTGTIEIDSGTLLLATGGTISGTLAGSGVLELGATSTTQLGNLAAPGGASILSLGTAAIKTKSATIAAGFTQQGGTISLATKTTLTAASSLNLTQGAIVTGLATLSTLGSTSVAPTGGTIGLRGGVTWTNLGTVTLGGSVLTLSPTTFSNGPTGTFALAADGAGIFAGGGNSKFTNQGLLTKIGGTGISEVDSTLNSSGTIAVNTGTILLTANATLSGVLSGAGTLQLNGKRNSITGLSSTAQSNLLVGAGSVLSISFSTLAGSTTISQGTLQVAANASLSGGLTQSGGTISIGLGVALTVGGASALSGGCVITGSGTMITTGSVVAGADGAGLSLQHTAWSNTGTVTLDSVLACNGGAGITNAVGAVFAFGADSGSIQLAAGSSIFTNSGTLMKSAGNGTSTLGSALTSTGTITVATGTLDLAGGGTVSGTVNGNGTLLFGGGSFTVAGGTAVAVENIVVGGGTVSVSGGEAVEVDGAFALGAGTLVMAAGDTLTLTGGATFGNGGTLSGAATLLTSGAVAIGANGSTASFSNGIDWTNTGTVTVGGQIATGGPGAVAFVNATGAVFDFTSDSAGIIDTGSASTFENDGTFAKTGGNGTSAIFSSIDNTGTLLADSGTLALEFIATLGGTVGGQGGGLVFLASGANTNGPLAITDNGASASVQLSGGYADWTNSGSVSDAGQVLLGNGQANPALLLNAPGATWDFTTDDAGFTGAGSVMLINVGTIAKTGGSGVSQIGFGFTNGGIIDAASGTLALEGAVTGNGTLRIEAGDTLEMGQAVQASQTVVFAGNGATLKLDVAASVAGAMQGFGAGSMIDLAGTDADGASISGNTLTVTAGGNSYSFTSAQSLSGLSAQITGDGSGGSLVTLSTASLAHASPAFLGSGSGAAQASIGAPFAAEFPSAAAPAPIVAGGYTAEPGAQPTPGFAAMMHAQAMPPLALAYWHGG